MEEDAGDPPDGGGGRELTPPDSHDSFSKPMSKQVGNQLPDKQPTKRTLSNNSAEEIIPPKKTTLSPSIQDVYVVPEYESNDMDYRDADKGPYVVHVSKIDTENSGEPLKILKFAQFIHKNKITGITEGGIKSIGRNKMSLEFRTATDANTFKKSEILGKNSFSATIPKFHITRMGVVKNVPSDWTLEEFVQNLKCPNQSVTVIKARRLNRRIQHEGKSQWVPSTTVVLTFIGQILPERVYCYYTSLPISLYELPVIQCRNCCRFGHVAKQCRSSPRCYRCSQPHRGDQCEIAVENTTCVLCTGRHMATYGKCPEHGRQKSIKKAMSENFISYSEASIRFPKTRSPYADLAKSNVPPKTATNTPVFPQSRTTYKKTTYNTIRPRIHSAPAYNFQAHYDITTTPQSSQPNGCALQNNTDLNSNQDNSMVLLTRFLQNTVTSNSDIYPPQILQLVQQALQTLESFFSGSYNGPELPTMEL